MKRQQVIAIVVVLVLAAGAGAGYTFYLQPSLAKFAADQQFLSELTTKLGSLKKTFAGGKPEAVLARVKEKTQPWHDTLNQRVTQFGIRDFLKIDDFPKTDVLKAYYAQTSKKMVDELAFELASKGVYYQPSIDFYFQMPRPDELEGKKVNGLQAMHWLQTIRLGTSITRMLVDAEMLGIDDLNLWPPRTAADGFTSYTVGVSMWMTMDQFCKFMDKLYSDETMCITINGFRVTNTALRAYPDPPLRIELVFQIDNYKLAPVAKAAAAQAVAAPGGAPSAVPAGTADALLQMKSQRAGGAAGTGKTETQGKEKSWWRQWLPF